MFGLWCSNPIIEATGKLDSNPIWYLKFYVFSRSSFLLILPHLLLTPLVPPPNLLVSPPITLPSLTSPIPITFYRPTSPDSEPLPHVGPEPVALNNRILSLQDVRLHHLQTHLPHFLLHHLLQGGGTPKFCPKSAAAVFMWDNRPPYYEKFQGTRPWGRSSPMSPTQREEQYESLPWKISPTPTCLPLPSQDPLKLAPRFLHLPKFYPYNCPFIIQFLQDCAKVLEQ